MQRGDIYSVVLPKELGKPRPALIVQSELYHAATSLVVCPLTTKLLDAPHLRITVEPSKVNGITLHSQIMVDKIAAVPHERFGKKIGHVDEEIMQQVARSLIALLALH